MRRRILELLARGEMSAGAIGATIHGEFAITQPAVSQHLKVLRDNGFASVRPDGQRRLYAVNGSALRDVDEWLERSAASGHRTSPRLAPRSHGGNDNDEGRQHD